MSLEPDQRRSLADRDPDELALMLADLSDDAPPEGEPQELAAAIVERLSDAELRALPEVRAVVEDPDVPVREDMRADLEAAALGELVEVEREQAARRHSGAENDAAPDSDPLAEALPLPGRPEDDAPLTLALARARFLAHGDVERFEREAAQAIAAEEADGENRAR